LETPDIEHLKVAFELLRVLGIDTLHIVHVYNPEKTKLFTDKTVVHAIESVFADKDIRFHYINNPVVEEGLDNFIKDMDIDILITASNRKTFWDKLFGTHFSKKIAIHTHIPLLVIK
jgi:nucleotide-binding universal stress UspA family protein